MYLFIYIAVFLPAIVLVSSRPRDKEGQQHRASDCWESSDGKSGCNDPAPISSNGGGTGEEDALTRLFRQMDEAENDDGEIDEAASQMDEEFDEMNQEVNEEANEMDDEAAEINEEANEQDDEAAEEANEMDEEAAEIDEEANKEEEENDMDQE